MLTRLKVSGFKNLVDVDVHFGPFTCIAGANGVGKSNLFDAIQFLSKLADTPLMKAAMSIRSEQDAGRTTNIQNLFYHYGETHVPKLSFEVEMLVPKQGYDDLGQVAEASITFLRYGISLLYEEKASLHNSGQLEIVGEFLERINLSEAHKHLPFKHSKEWRKSVVSGRRSSSFISTETDDDGQIVIKRHQDGGSSGRPLSFRAADLPRSVLSVANAAESPTALLARREMQSWQFLQLEPSSLRRPSAFTATPRLGADGANLAATLYRLASNGRPDITDSNRVYAQLANRLAELIGDVRYLSVDPDKQRELLTVQMTDQSNTVHPAQALSDGTLRFLALATLEADPEAQGLLCLEEPENGIHPERIGAMLDLLQDICTDVEEPVNANNPLRQVIVNTHSPTVVNSIPPDTLLFATKYPVMKDGTQFWGIQFQCLPDTWRAKRKSPVPTVALGNVLTYLNPIQPTPPHRQAAQKPQRVIDHPRLQMSFLSTLASDSEPE